MTYRIRKTTTDKKIQPILYKLKNLNLKKYYKNVQKTKSNKYTKSNILKL